MNNSFLTYSGFFVPVVKTSSICAYLRCASYQMITLARNISTSSKNPVFFLSTFTFDTEASNLAINAVGLSVVSSNFNCASFGYAIICKHSTFFSTLPTVCAAGLDTWNMYVFLTSNKIKRGLNTYYNDLRIRHPKTSSPLLRYVNRKFPISTL